MNFAAIREALKTLNVYELSEIAHEAQALEAAKREAFENRCNAILDEIYALRKEYPNSDFLVSDPEDGEEVNLLAYVLPRFEIQY